jgi:hypothetical protein
VEFSEPPARQVRRAPSTRSGRFARMLSACWLLWSRDEVMGSTLSKLLLSVVQRKLPLLAYACWLLWSRDEVQGSALPTILFSVVHRKLPSLIVDDRKHALFCLMDCNEQRQTRGNRSYVTSRNNGHNALIISRIWQQL